MAENILVYFTLCRLFIHNCLIVLEGLFKNYDEFSWKSKNNFAPLKLQSSEIFKLNFLPTTTFYIGADTCKFFGRSFVWYHTKSFESGKIKLITKE